MQDPTKTEELANQNIVQNKEQDVGVLDPQTLENLAAFLSRENEESKHEKRHEENKQENFGGHDESAHKQKHDDNKASRSVSRSRSREKSQQRWVYCCSKCKKNDKKGKTCVCVVPASQRRISISKEGCSSCGCFGCSKEDVQLRQEKKAAEESQERSDSLEKMRNGCCKECMKAFSSIRKACLCQVPSSVRRRKLPDNGCLICGCFGCNPEDTQKLAKEENGVSKGHEIKFARKGSNNNNSRNNNHRNDSESVSMSRSRSVSSDISDHNEPPLDNLDNSYIGGFLKNTFNIYLPLIGFGIPQRSYSYIYGKAPPH